MSCYDDCSVRTEMDGWIWDGRMDGRMAGRMEVEVLMSWKGMGGGFSSGYGCGWIRE